jgi:hypothetical protein
VHVGGVYHTCVAVRDTDFAADDHLVEVGSSCRDRAMLEAMAATPAPMLHVSPRVEFLDLACRRQGCLGADGD